MTYYFNTTNNTANNNYDNCKIDLSKYYKNTKYENDLDFTSSILNKIKSIFPWATKENKNIYRLRTNDDSDKNYILLDITPDALNYEWNKAASMLYHIADSDSIYDFKIGNVPVKIYGNYIQVGSKIIPKFTSSNFFNNYSKKDRILLYNISLEINTLEIAA